MTLIKYALLIREMIHDESMELINGWTFLDPRRSRWSAIAVWFYVNASDVITAMFACIVTRLGRM